MQKSEVTNANSLLATLERPTKEGNTNVGFF
jgi:hypothetical protein